MSPVTRSPKEGDRIDVFDMKDDAAVAIALDNRSLRETSILKLLRFARPVVRLVCVRGGSVLDCPPGIDGVILLPLAEESVRRY